MFVSDGLGVNESGHLTVGGCDTVSLAKKYGTPYMCYDENMIRKNCREFVKSMEENYDGNGLVCYASKAFSWSSDVCSSDLNVQNMQRRKNGIRRCFGRRNFYRR